MSFRVIWDNAKVQEESITSCRTATAKVVGMSSINRTEKLARPVRNREDRET